MENDIASYLDALKRDACYRVVRVLKEAPHETTEVVCFAGANDAELGPFVRKRIKREACMGAAYPAIMAAQRAGARFRHLPRIEDCYERDDELVVIMEYVRGETLHETVYRRDPSPALAQEVFPLLCDAVVELHEGFDPPLIHRDLKPGNVILSEGNLTLIDFGIARAYREGAEGDTASFGTRAYAPPEQFGYGQTDVRSDVYALGMLLYYLLTEEVPSPRLAGGAFDEPGVPVALRPVLARATAFDPAARYPSVRALRAAFAAAVAGPRLRGRPSRAATLRGRRLGSGPTWAARRGPRRRGARLGRLLPQGACRVPAPKRRAASRRGPSHRGRLPRRCRAGARGGSWRALRLLSPWRPCSWRSASARRLTRGRGRAWRGMHRASAGSASSPCSSSSWRRSTRWQTGAGSAAGWGVRCRAPGGRQRRW